MEPTRAATGPSSPFPTSQALFEAARAVIPGGVTSSVRAGARPHPLYLERGQGPYVWDVDGNRYVDYALGYGPLILGHAPIVVRDAIAPQLERGLTFGSQHRLEPQLAELLVQTVPGADQVIFATTGSEAVAAAIRLARVVTGRDLVIKFEGHYHGWFDGLFASTGFDPGRSGPADRPATVPATLGIPPAALADVVVAQWNDIASVEQILAEHPSAVAAILCEPVAVNGGLIVGPGRVPRGAPRRRDPFRGAPRVRRGHHRDSASRSGVHRSGRACEPTSRCSPKRSQAGSR